MPNVQSRISENLSSVRERMADAARRAGRSPDDVTLVAVVKTRPIAQIEALIAAGQTTFAENRVQEALPKIDAIGNRAEWHLIGHLQRNKAKTAAQCFALIHSVDSKRLLLALNQAGEAQSRPVPVLIQINVSGEDQKFGCAPADAPELIHQALGLPFVQPEGLMAMAAWTDDPERARPSFQLLRRLRDELAGRGTPISALRRLSMGMSNDYEVAIEEGATLVRVGSALFTGLE